MEASYRRPLIAQEVLGYNADIVCLQEMDEKAFATYFHPVMQHAGALALLFTLLAGAQSAIYKKCHSPRLLCGRHLCARRA